MTNKQKLNDKKIDLSKGVIATLLSILSTIALSAMPHGGNILFGSSDINVFLINIANLVSGNTLASTILFVFLTRLFYGILPFRFKEHKTELFLAVVFGLLTIIGLSFSINNSLDLILQNNTNWIFAIILLCGYVTVFTAFIVKLYAWIEKRQRIPNKPLRTSSSRFGNVGRFIGEHTFWSSFVLILAGWLFYIILFFPGTISWDGIDEINQYSGFVQFSNLQPFFVTLVMGAIVHLGKAIVSYNFGLFLYVLFQSCLSALIYATISSKVAEISKRHLFGFLTAVFFSLTPVWGFYAQTVIKDTMYFSVFALFSLTIYEIYALSKTATRLVIFQKYAVSLLVAFLLILLRNNGFYIVVPSFLALLFLRRKEFIMPTLLVIIVVTVGNWGYTKVLLPDLNVKPTLQRESLSIPLQQTARTVTEHQHQITKHEQKAISAVMNYKDLPVIYKVNKSDAVKGTFKENATKAQKANYFKTWMEMGLKYPKSYISAFLNQTYLYYYPFSNYVEYANTDINDTPFFGSYYWFPKYMMVDKYNFHYAFSSEVQNFGINLAEVFRNLPVLCLLVNSAFYFWLLLLCAGYLIKYHQLSKFVAFVSSGMNFLVCLAGPVNGLLRYALPIASFIPIIIALTITVSNTTDEGGSEVLRKS